MKRFNAIPGIVDTGLITLTVFTVVMSTGVFASGVGLLVGIKWNYPTSSLATVIKLKSFKTFTVKQEKHDSFKLLAQSKLDSIVDIISQIM